MTNALEGALRAVVLAAMGLGALACGGGGGDADSGMVALDDAGRVDGTDAGRGDGTDAGRAGTDAGGGGGTDSGTPSAAWTVRPHDCPGANRADALWVDDDHTMWVGCGSNATGNGLYVSSDDGASWALPSTSPANVLTSFRVLSVHRGYGGLIYVAGQGSGGVAVISLDSSASPMAAAAVLNRGSTVGTSFQVSPFVTTSTGAAFADSFTGVDALYRPDPAIGESPSAWTDARAWETPSGSHQILDMVVRGDRFVGVGSTISEPPYVFVPTDAGEAYGMRPVQLVSGLGAWTGELWGVAASAARIVAVGVDHTNHIGKIFISGADETDAAGYTQIDIDPLIARVTSGRSTWARGVCMDGNRIAVVGEVQPLSGSTGFVLLSDDGGATFTEATPAGSPPSWSKCQFVGSRLVVAGGATIAFRDDL